MSRTGFYTCAGLGGDENFAAFLCSTSAGVVGELGDDEEFDMYGFGPIGINDNGVLVGDVDNSSDSSFYGAIWVDSGEGPIGLPVYDTSQSIYGVEEEAVAINDNGVIVGFSTDGNTGLTTPILWANSTSNAVNINSRVVALGKSSLLYPVGIQSNGNIIGVGTNAKGASAIVALKAVTP
jgi:hypothetical protein